MKRSCICMSMMYTLYIYRYSQFVVVTLKAIKSSRTLGNTFANTDINGFWSPADTAALKSKNTRLVLFVAPYHVYPWTSCTSIKIILELHQVAVYSYIHENHAELWATRSTTSPLISFCHSRWQLLDARDWLCYYNCLYTACLGSFRFSTFYSSLGY